jgi:hypothetical protein
MASGAFNRKAGWLAPANREKTILTHYPAPLYNFNPRPVIIKLQAIAIGRPGRVLGHI